jgi:phosphatidylglycerol---prolipoprotein diacylglyceryl transferase
MHPYLFDWVIAGHHFKPPSYGVMLAFGFTLAYFNALHRASKLGEDPKHIENLFVTVVICSLVGSRMFHVLFEEPRYYLANPGKVWAVWEGGYTLYGAILLAMAGVYWYAWWKKMSFRQLVDIATTSTALGVGIGRVGCFLAGCCWGKVCTLPWAVTFTHPDTFAGPKGIPVHPTQLYEAFGAFLIYGYTLWKFPRRNYEGQILFHSLVAYAAIRFIVEIYRGDQYRGFLFGGYVSYSQFISLIMFAFGLVGILIFRKKSTT